MGQQAPSKCRSSASVSIARDLRPLVKVPKLGSAGAPSGYDVPQLLGNASGYASGTTRRTQPQWAWSLSTVNLRRSPPTVGSGDYGSRCSPERVEERQARSIAKHLNRSSAGFFGVKM